MKSCKVADCDSIREQSCRMAFSLPALQDDFTDGVQGRVKAVAGRITVARKLFLATGHYSSSQSNLK